jgi:hypothetical protein
MMTDIVDRLYDKGIWPIPNLHEEAADEITRLREENEKMKYFLRHNVFAEKQYGVYFICGEGGEKDQNGIPEQIHVCPAYGSDVVYRYIRDPNQKVFGPEW